jgi:hypothetical protein
MSKVAPSGIWKHVVWVSILPIRKASPPSCVTVAAYVDTLEAACVAGHNGLGRYSEARMEGTPTITWGAILPKGPTATEPEGLRPLADDLRDRYMPAPLAACRWSG